MDVVDKLKAELCKFVSTKLGAKYADQLSIMKIVDKYNSHVGTVEGLPVDCITIHNRLLVVRYNQEHHTLEDINRIYNIVNDVIRDNTAISPIWNGEIHMKSHGNLREKRNFRH